MNIEAVNDAHALFKNGGYNGTIEDFQSLIATNDEALSDAHKLFINGGYNGTIEDFSTLVGVKKKDEVLDSGSKSEEIVTTSDTEQVEQSTPLVSSSGDCPPGKVFNPKTGKCEDIVPSKLETEPLDPKVAKFLGVEVKENQTQEKPTLVERALGKDEFTDFLGDTYRSIRQGVARPVESSIDLYVAGNEISDKKLEKYIEAVNYTESLGESDEMRDFQKTYEEEGSGIFGVLKGLYDNPSIAPQVLVSSISAMARPSVLVS